MADVKGVEATYIDFTRKTAKYPKRREKEYLMIGLMNEAGEVGGAFKKEIRDRVDNTDLIIDEMGDVLWYLTRLCDVYGLKISDLMLNNIDKLFQRMTPEEAKVWRASRAWWILKSYQYPQMRNEKVGSNYWRQP